MIGDVLANVIVKGVIAGYVALGGFVFCLIIAGGSSGSSTVFVFLLTIFATLSQVLVAASLKEFVNDHLLFSLALNAVLILSILRFAQTNYLAILFALLPVAIVLLGERRYINKHGMSMLLLLPTYLVGLVLFNFLPAQVFSPVYFIVVAGLNMYYSKHRT